MTSFIPKQNKPLVFMSTVELKETLDTAIKQHKRLVKYLHKNDLELLENYIDKLENIFKNTNKISIQEQAANYIPQSTIGMKLTSKSTLH